MTSYRRVKLALLFLMKMTLIYSKFLIISHTEILLRKCELIQAVGGRPPRYAPPLSYPSVGVEAPRAVEPTAAPAEGNVAVGCHAQYVPMFTAAAA